MVEFMTMCLIGTMVGVGLAITIWAIMIIYSIIGIGVVHFWNWFSYKPKSIDKTEKV